MSNYYLKLKWKDGEKEILTFQDCEGCDKFLRMNEGEYVPESVQRSYGVLTEGLTVYELLKELEKLGLTMDNAPVHLGNGYNPIKKIETDGEIVRLYI